MTQTMKTVTKKTTKPNAPSEAADAMALLHVEHKLVSGLLPKTRTRSDEAHL
jgi:hypothetical protein